MAQFFYRGSCTREIVRKLTKKKYCTEEALPLPAVLKNVKIQGVYEFFVLTCQIDALLKKA
jgi:hypothetical protein